MTLCHELLIESHKISIFTLVGGCAGVKPLYNRSAQSPVSAGFLNIQE